MKFLFALTCVSFIIYTIFLVTIIRFRNKKPFNSSFFTLCIPLGVIDLLSIVNSYINHKFPDWGWYSDFEPSSWYAGVMARVGLNMAYFCAYCQTLSLLALAVNRCTVFICPLKHQQLWSKWLKCVLIGQIVLPSIPVLPQLIFAHLHYHCLNITNGCFVVYSDWKQERIFLNIASVFIGLLAVAIGVLYGIMFYAAYKHRHTNITHHNVKLELRFGICGFVTFLAMLSYCAVCFYLGETESKYKRHQLFQYWYIVSDVYGWINPFLILSCSAMVRQGFVATMLCRTKLEKQSDPPSKLLTGERAVPAETGRNTAEPRILTKESIVLLPKEVSALYVIGSK